MELRAELILTGDSGLQALATQAETAALRPTQMEHEIDWIAHSDHPARATAGVARCWWKNANTFAQPSSACSGR